jgi:hypothetical protein
MLLTHIAFFVLEFYRYPERLGDALGHHIRGNLSKPRLISPGPIYPKTRLLNLC